MSSVTSISRTTAPILICAGLRANRMPALLRGSSQDTLAAERLDDLHDMRAGDVETRDDLADRRQRLALLPANISTRIA